MKNYYSATDGKNVSHLFFNDISAMETESAYRSAMALVDIGLTVALWAPVRCHDGPWDKVPLIGHRSREAIERDLANFKSEGERETILEELAMLTARFI